MTRLSEHFTLAELTVSETAARRGLDNTPPPSALGNLVRLAALLEAVRTQIGRPVIVISGYRAPEVNRLVGGNTGSAHTAGRAADIISPAFGTPLQLARAIEASGLPFDQVIHEFGRWVHVSIAPEGAPPRRMALTIDLTGTRTGLA
jgi:zinc D-Ala-D-Ala carboxypeptidase